MNFNGLYEEARAATANAQTEEGRRWQEAFKQMHKDYLKMKDERDDYKWRYERLRDLINAGHGI